LQPGRYTDYISWRATALMTGRHEDLARHYLAPALITAGCHTYVLHSHDEIVLDLHRLRIALNENGIQRLLPQIVAIELPRLTQRIWVKWQALDQRGALVGTSDTIYHFDRSRGDMKVIGLTNQSVLIPEFANPNYRNRLQRSRKQSR